MILSKLENAPEKKIPIAMALIVVGLSMTVIGASWSRFAPSVPHIGTDWNDFFRGAIFGVAIVLEIAGVAIAASAAAQKSVRRNEIGCRFDRICSRSSVRVVGRAGANRHAAIRLILSVYFAAFGLLY